MIRRPPRSTRTDTLFPYTTLFRSFRRDHPEDFRLLAETEIPFYWEHEGFDIRARRRVIELDRFGAVSGVTISQHLADVLDLPPHLLDAYYPALRRFARLLRAPKYLVRYRLKARSEERRVGTHGRSTCRYRWFPPHQK